MRDKANAAGLTQSEIEPQLDGAKLGEPSKEMVTELAPLIAQEWGLDPQVSPTLAAGLILAPWLWQSGSAYMALADLAKEKAEREKAKEARLAQSQTKKDGEALP